MLYFNLAVLALMYTT